MNDENLKEFVGLVAFYRRAEQQLERFYRSPDFRVELSGKVVGTASYKEKLRKAEDRLLRVHIDPEAVREIIGDDDERAVYVQWARERAANLSKEDRRVFEQALREYRIVEAEIVQYEELIQRSKRLKKALLSHPWLEARLEAEREQTEYTFYPCAQRHGNAVALPSTFKDRYIDSLMGSGKIY